MNNQALIEGAGLGLRREMMSEEYQLDLSALSFLEVAPENWIHVGGRFGTKFRQITEQLPISLHGLSLNLGGFSDIDIDLVKSIKKFIAIHHCPFYSEHLSYCGDSGHLYDLMPIPFTEEAVKVVSARIRQVQDILEQRIAIENVSYYAVPDISSLSEIDFINAVISEADCDLLLDVNNIYVNSINHGYDAEDFLRALPGERATYIHVAGHYDEADDLKVDTHGSGVIEPVWALLEKAYQQFGILPTLLERDFNIPEQTELMVEIQRIQALQDASASTPVTVLGNAHYV